MEVLVAILGAFVFLGIIGAVGYRNRVSAQILELQSEHTTNLKALTVDGEKRVERIERAAKKEQERAEQGFAKDLLPVLDALDSASKIGPDADRAVVLEGLALVGQSFHRVLSEHDIESICPSPEDVFDPQIHEAVDLRDGFEKNQIVECLRPGYQQGDDVLRPAMVAVGSGQIQDEEE